MDVFYQFVSGFADMSREIVEQVAVCVILAAFFQ